MAAIDDDALAVLEFWLGPITAGEKFGELTDLEHRFDRIGVAEVVALEVLSARLSRMSQLSTQVRGDDTGSDHTENLKAMRSLISNLVAAIRNNDDLSLTTAQEKIVAAAEGSPPTTSGTFAVTASNRRAG